MYAVFLFCEFIYFFQIKSILINRFQRFVSLFFFCFVLFKVTVNQSIINIDESEFESTIEESEGIERDYHAYFDLTIVNEDMGRCFNSLVDAIDALRAEPQWVPITWLY